MDERLVVALLSYDPIVDDWWHTRAVDHGLVIVMPDGGELVLPERVAQRLATVVWQHMSVDERDDAVNYLEENRRARTQQRSQQEAALDVTDRLLDRDAVPRPPQPLPVDLLSPFGDPAASETMPDAWATPVKAAVALLIAGEDADDDEKARSEASSAAQDEKAKRLHEDCLARWANLTDGQRRNYRFHDWPAHCW